jgi:hypothetical protein
MGAVKQRRNYILLSIMAVLLLPLYILGILTLGLIDWIWFQMNRNEKWW